MKLLKKRQATKIVTPFNKECKRGKGNCGHSISVHNKHETVHAMVKNILAEDVIACHAKLQTNHQEVWFCSSKNLAYSAIHSFGIHGVSG